MNWKLRLWKLKHKGKATVSKENKILIWSILVFTVVFGLKGLISVDWQKWQKSWQEKWQKTETLEASDESQLTQEPLLPAELQGVELFYGEKNTLLLYNDGNFYLTGAYKEGDKKVEVQTGTWIDNKETGIITLTYESGETESWKRLEDQSVQRLAENGQGGEILNKETDIVNKVVNLKN